MRTEQLNGMSDAELVITYEYMAAFEPKTEDLPTIVNELKTRGLSWIVLD